MHARSIAFLIASACALAGASFSARALQRSDNADRAAALNGAWTLNTSASDAAVIDRGRDEEGARPRRDGRGLGFGGRRGGFGGAPGRDEPGRADQEASARQRQALEDIMNPPAHLLVVTTPAAVIITGPDGRATRLSPDGAKVKDENTGVERRTKWDKEKLVSEVSGLPIGKIVQTFQVTAEPHQLRITAEIDGRGGKRMIARVYDADSR